MVPDNTYLSLIVPMFNEESRLATPVPEVVRFLQETFPRWEMIYSDDGSTDSSCEIVRKLSGEWPSIRLVGSKQNAGKGAAVRRGFQAAEGNLLLFSDADFSTPIEESLKMIDAIQSGYEIAIGSRGLEQSQIEVHQSWARETMGKTFNLLLRTLLPLEFHDTQCGFKMFKREAANLILPCLHVDGFAFDVEMLVAAQQLRLRIAETPVIWRNVLESKVHPVRSSLQMIRDVFGIRYRLAMNLYG